jgi:transposase-like protein
MFVTGNQQTVDEIESLVTKIGHSKFLDSFYLKLNKHIDEEIENKATKTGRSNFKLLILIM